MKSSWVSILLVAALLGMLAALATMQYRWLGQISDGERERMQKRLDTDTARFAEEFNREIQLAYYTFQFNADPWRENDFAEFDRRYAVWREQAAFKELIKDFYFVREDRVFRYAADGKTFSPGEWTEELAGLRESLGNDKKFEPIDEKHLALLMPVYENPERLLTRDDKISVPLGAPEKFGLLVIKLDENVIKNEVLPALARKYFSDSEGAAYKLTVASRKNARDVVFDSLPLPGEIARQGEPADAFKEFFNLSPDNFAVFINRDLLPKIHPPGEVKELIVNQRFERQRITPLPSSSSAAFAPEKNKRSIMRFEGINGAAPRLVRRSEISETGGHWLLNVRHADGSLETFITNTRHKNLALSFGILLLLAASVVLIFLSARRAQILAQRQMDFVSAVSHEFRTPLAVIYSAGENLTDGVVDSQRQVSQYGNLIKREGKKLTAMVEQILEFAGARSGRQKYDLRPTDVRGVIENALNECQSLITEKGFTVEQEIAENLPKISADANALSHSIQNLITNALKYSDGDKWIKISALNGDSRIKISVEDKGIGISRKDISNIFTPFYRAKAVVDAQIHGNGLGLSLVKQTVKAHDGKILAESEPGKGSKFTMHLPVNIKHPPRDV